MFSTATTLGMRTKKELAGGTDGFQAREVQQDRYTSQPQGTDWKETPGNLGQGWSRRSQDRNLQL